MTMTQILIGCLLVVGLIPGLLVGLRSYAAWTITFAGAMVLILPWRFPRRFTRLPSKDWTCHPGPSTV